MKALEETLREVAEKIKKAREEKWNEATTCLRLILPVLESLGWDPRGPNVVAQFRVKVTGAVTDYALLVRNEPVFFIEAKAVFEELKDEHAGEVLKAAVGGDVKWCIVTNGDEWRVYGGSGWPGKMKEKLLYAVKVSEMVESEERMREAVEKFFLPLSKEVAEKGEADRKIKFAYCWAKLKQLLSDPPEGLVDLLLEIIGKPPVEKEIVAEALRAISLSILPAEHIQKLLQVRCSSGRKKWAQDHPFVRLWDELWRRWETEKPAEIERVELKPTKFYLGIRPVYKGKRLPQFGVHPHDKGLDIWFGKKYVGRAVKRWQEEHKGKFRETKWALGARVTPEPSQAEIGLEEAVSLGLALFSDLLTKAKET